MTESSRAAIDDDIDIVAAILEHFENSVKDIGQLRAANQEDLAATLELFRPLVERMSTAESTTAMYKFATTYVTGLLTFFVPEVRSRKYKAEVKFALEELERRIGNWSSAEGRGNDQALKHPELAEQARSAARALDSIANSLRLLVGAPPKTQN
jgi:hypothetical protein